MPKDLAIVLNSGSLNSAVVTALAAQRHRPIMLHVLRTALKQDMDDMGSRGRVAFEQQVAHFKPYREHELAMPFLTLLDSTNGAKHGPAAPEPRQQGPIAPAMLELLPLMAVASRFAAHYQAVAIYLGLRVGSGADELAQATEFVQIWTEMLQHPCGLPDVEFIAPLTELEPWQMIDLAFQVNAPLERTWSCANDGGDPCWACRGCRTREAAFQQSGKPDPLRAVRK